QRLMLQTPLEGVASQAHRRAAIVAFEDYLRAAPQAPDRPEVERQLVLLHDGLPKTPRTPEENGWESSEGTDPRLDDAELGDLPDDPVLEASEPEEPASDETATEAPPAPAKPPEPSGLREFPRGRLRVHGVLALTGTWGRSQATDVTSMPELGGLVGLAALIGRRRGASLGAEAQWTSQPTASERFHHLMAWHVLFEGGYGVRLGRTQRVELRITALAGFRSQRLIHRGQTETSCPLRPTGLVSRRRGMRAGGRVAVYVSLGKQRRHEIGVLVSPTGSLYDDGDTSRRTTCDTSPFGELGLEAVEFDLGISTGYGLRF